MDSDSNSLILKNSQWIIADMVAVHVRNDEGINITQISSIFAEDFSGPFHGTQTAINKDLSAISPDQQTIALAAASQALKV